MLNARPLDTAGGGPSSSVWWLALGLLVIVLIGTAALLFMRQRRRQETALCAEWLEPSAPRSGVSEDAMPRWGAVTPTPSSRSTPRPSDRAMDSVPASRPSRMGPPASERQWLSQRPPRSSKEPPA
jgi:LPXTG-motif cell wall-anchored protein